MTKTLWGTIAAMLVVTACADGGQAPRADDRPRVVATTGIIGDVVSATFGSAVVVDVLMPGSQDPHSYRASPDQVTLIYEADLVVANGLGLEEALDDILDAALRDGVTVIRLGDVVSPLEASGHEDADHDSEGETGSVDPHFWFDPVRMERAIEYLAAALDDAAPGTWAELSVAYRMQLRDLDLEIESMVAAIPEPDRRLVTNHATLGYFADRYGFATVGSVFSGTSTLAEASAKDLAALIELVQTTHVRAIFSDATRPAYLAEVIADESDTDIAVVELFTGALGEAGSGADTYLGYMSTNAALIVGALSP